MRGARKTFARRDPTHAVMQQRDRFDLVLLVVLAVVLTLERYGTSGAIGTPGAVADAVLSLDVVVYLVVGSVLGVAFVGYIAVYLPYKQSENAPR